MKKFICPSLLTLCLLSCTNISSSNPGNGNFEVPADASRISGTLESFNAISSSGALNVKFIQSEKSAIEIAGKQEDIEKVEYRISDGKLSLKTQSPKKQNIFNWQKNDIGPVYITVYAPGLKSVSNSGAGFFTADSLKCTDDFQIGNSGAGTVRIGTISTPKFKISNSGAGEFRISQVTSPRTEISNSGAGEINIDLLQGETLKISNSGAGEISAKGSAVSAEYSNSGAGELRLGDLKCQTVQVRNSGAGEVSLHATGKVRKKNSGAGEINVKGGGKIEKL